MKQPDPIKKTGKSMLVAAWIIGLAMLYFIFNSMLQQQAQPNRYPASSAADGQNQVVLQRNRQGHYLTSGSINGYPVTFLVDTGASDIAIPATVARRIGLSKGYPVTFSTANGPAKGWATKIKTLNIGTIKLTRLRASINPGLNRSDAVLLGMSALKQLDFEQRGRELILQQKKR